MSSKTDDGVRVCLLYKNRRRILLPNDGGVGTIHVPEMQMRRRLVICGGRGGDDAAAGNDLSPFSSGLDRHVVQRWKLGGGEGDDKFCILTF